MFELKGAYTTAICYANIVEQEAISQILRMCNHEFTAGSRVRIMPDVHAGKGCTIGTTMTVTDKVVPNIVGVDIGCGMYVVTLGYVTIDLAALDRAAHSIPSGMQVWDRIRHPFDLKQLRCYNRLQNLGHLECSLGTLGGGNHFIEANQAQDGTLYLVIHSGSRNIGKQVAEYYQKLAISLHNGKESINRERQALIAQYKANGTKHRLQQALKEFELEHPKRSSFIPDDLCYLYGSYLEDYLHDVKVCQDFARRNREAIAEVLLQSAGLTALDSFHTIHNYIDTDEMILRKGAIAAHEGERVLIPINMRDGSILAIGRGNPDWNYSAPHGAGRLMSRSQAKATLSMEEYQEAMAGIYTTSVSQSTLDESPMAYKSLEDILESVQESVDVLDVLKPIYNFKA